MKDTTKQIIKYSLALILVFVFLLALLILPLGWLANHVPSGFVGLTIFFGYFLVIGALLIFMIIIIGRKLMKIEYKLKLENLRSYGFEHNSQRAIGFPTNTIESLKLDDFKYQESKIEIDGKSLPIIYLIKNIKVNPLMKSKYTVFVFLTNWGEESDQIGKVTDTVINNISQSSEYDSKKMVLNLSVCFFANRLNKKIIDFCSSNFIDINLIYIPVAYEKDSGKSYYLRGKPERRNSYGKLAELIEKYF